ncbi:hypothetical protein OC844_007986, partial [Tilletia horrida]
PGPHLRQADGRHHWLRSATGARAAPRSEHAALVGRSPGEGSFGRLRGRGAGGRGARTRSPQRRDSPTTPFSPVTGGWIHSSSRSIPTVAERAVTNEARQASPGRGRVARHRRAAMDRRTDAAHQQSGRPLTTGTSSRSAHRAAEQARLRHQRQH